jgi:hypothetical protein
MSKAILVLTAVIFGLSSPALAAGKGGGGGGGGSGQNATNHAPTGGASSGNTQTQQHPNIRKSGGDPKSAGKGYLRY